MLSADEWREYAAQIEAVSDVPGYPFPVGPSVEDCLEVAALIEAARSALVLLEYDRNALFESNRQPSTNEVTDPDARAELVEYDTVIKAFRALLPPVGEGETPTDHANVSPLPDAEAEALGYPNPGVESGRERASADYAIERARRNFQMIAGFANGYGDVLRRANDDQCAACFDQIRDIATREADALSKREVEG